MNKDRVFSVGDRARLGNSLVNIERSVKLIGMPQAYVVTNDGNMSLVYEENLQPIYIPEDGQKFRVEKWPALVMRCVETNHKEICYVIISDDLSPGEVGCYDSFPLLANVMIPVDEDGGEEMER